MNIGFQQIFVTMIALVPGFIVTSIHRIFAPKRYASDLQWLVISLLIALILNFIMVISYLIFTESKLIHVSVKDLSTQLQNVTVLDILIYLGLLYFSSIVVGIIFGLFPESSIQGLLNRIGLTKFTEHTSVWHRVFNIRRPKDRRKTWLRLKLNDGRIVLGYLRNSSAYIDKDKAFEVYLERPHEWVKDKWIPLWSNVDKNEIDGIYTRIIPSQVAEFLFVESAEWSPNNPLKTNTEPSPK